MSLCFEGVVVDLPPEVDVTFEDGRLQMNFRDFTGTVSLTPRAKPASPADEEALGVAHDRAHVLHERTARATTCDVMRARREAARCW